MKEKEEVRGEWRVYYLHGEGKSPSVELSDGGSLSQNLRQGAMGGRQEKDLEGLCLGFVLGQCLI